MSIADSSGKEEVQQRQDVSVVEEVDEEPTTALGHLEENLQCVGHGRAHEGEDEQEQYELENTADTPSFFLQDKTHVYHFLRKRLIGRHMSKAGVSLLNRHEADKGQSKHDKIQHHDESVCQLAVSLGL